MPLAQRVVTESELTKLLDESDLSDHDKRYILDVIYYHIPNPPFDTDPKSARRLSSRVVPEYNSGDYTLAYQGTNFDSNADWIVNLAKAWVPRQAHYIAAQVIAFHVNRLDLPGLQLSGQSLGGGLASLQDRSLQAFMPYVQRCGTQLVIDHVDGTEIIQGKLAPLDSKTCLSRRTKFGKHLFQILYCRMNLQIQGKRSRYSRKLFSTKFYRCDHASNGSIITNAPPAIGNIIEIEGLYN
ncbi:MAG: hypothetical protein R3C05_12540 [Pirellulaceae bacterium]